MAHSQRLSSDDFKSLQPLRRVYGAHFSLSVARCGDGIKWACVVSKKASAKAVSRNLVKRRARAVLAPLLQNSRAPIALIFHAKRSAADASFAALKEDLRSLAERSGVVGAKGDSALQ